MRKAVVVSCVIPLILIHFYFLENRVAQVYYWTWLTVNSIQSYNISLLKVQSEINA